VCDEKKQSTTSLQYNSEKAYIPIILGGSKLLISGCAVLGFHISTSTVYRCCRKCQSFSESRTSHMIPMIHIKPTITMQHGTASSEHIIPNIASSSEPPRKSMIHWPFSRMTDTQAGGKGKSDQTPSIMNSEDEHSQTLPPLLTLEPFDVILGRGRTHLHHPGNMRMQLVWVVMTNLSTHTQQPRVWRLPGTGYELQ
jgi:hypothetical protein